MQTHGGFQWELGQWYETSGEGDLCSPGWLHFYTNPLLAVLLNSVHTNILHHYLTAEEGTMGLLRGLVYALAGAVLAATVVTEIWAARYNRLQNQHIALLKQHRDLLGRHNADLRDLVVLRRGVSTANPN